MSSLMSSLMLGVRCVFIPVCLYVSRYLIAKSHWQIQCYVVFNVDQFLFVLLASCSILSDSLWPHGLQHVSLPCPSPTPRACSNSWPSSQWCHSTISSSVIPFSSCLQSLPASGSFQWVSSSHQVAKVLEFQLQHQSFQWIVRTDFL